MILVEYLIYTYLNLEYCDTLKLDLNIINTWRIYRMSSILEKLVENRKMPVLFIGSGISKRYLYKFPDWETLLKTSFYKVNQDPYFYQQHKDELLRKNLTDFEINKALGTIIENEFNRAFFSKKNKNQKS